MSNVKYEEDIGINPDALDCEWVKQASLFFRYAELAAKARDATDRAKERLDVLMADLGLKIRSNPASHGLEKVTEGAVQSTIMLKPEYTEANKKLADLKYEYEVLIAAVRALDQKKSALENLVRLQGQNYFAGPSVPRDVGKEWAKDTERTGARDRVKAAMSPQVLGSKQQAGRVIKRSL